MKTSSLIFTLMICRNFFAHRNAVCKTRDGLVAKQPGPSIEIFLFSGVCEVLHILTAYKFYVYQPTDTNKDIKNCFQNEFEIKA